MLDRERRKLAPRNTSKNPYFSQLEFGDFRIHDGVPALRITPSP